jgi:hypothetical protein
VEKLTPLSRFKRIVHHVLRSDIIVSSRSFWEYCMPSSLCVAVLLCCCDLANRLSRASSVYLRVIGLLKGGAVSQITLFNCC